MQSQKYSLSNRAAAADSGANPCTRAATLAMFMPASAQQEQSCEAERRSSIPVAETQPDSGVVLGYN